MAPIDIVISIIKRHLRETNEANGMEEAFLNGKAAAYAELIEEFEGFKKIFN